MTRRILIVVDSLKVEAELNDSPTAEVIWKSLPIDGFANTWGDDQARCGGLVEVE